MSQRSLSSSPHQDAGRDGAAAAGGFLLLGVGVGLCAWRRRRRAPVWLADDWKDPPVEVTFSDSELEEDCVVDL